MTNLEFFRLTKSKKKEIKLAFYSQYIGQYCNGVKLTYSKIMMLGESEKFALKLKHLSNITEEDAIKCARIWTNNHYHEYKLEIIHYSTSKVMLAELRGKPKTTRVICIPKADQRSSYDRFFDIAISSLDEAHFITAGNIEFDGKEIFIQGVINAQQIVEITDYLRSKGYAMPFRGLSTYEMYRLNWIKFKNLKTK